MTEDSYTRLVATTREAATSRQVAATIQPYGGAREQAPAAHAPAAQAPPEHSRFFEES